MVFLECRISHTWSQAHSVCNTSIKLLMTYWSECLGIMSSSYIKRRLNTTYRGTEVKRGIVLKIPPCHGVILKCWVLFYITHKDAQSETMLENIDSKNVIQSPPHSGPGPFFCSNLLCLFFQFSSIYVYLSVCDILIGHILSPVDKQTNLSTVLSSRSSKTHHPRRENSKVYCTVNGIIGACSMWRSYAWGHVSHSWPPVFLTAIGSQRE